MAHKPQDALATLDPLLGPNSADAGALDLASAAYEEAHDTEKAVESLRQAILLDPQNVNLYLDFAAISATHQSFQVGINVVNDGINLQPKAAPSVFCPRRPSTSSWPNTTRPRLTSKRPTNSIRLNP